MTKSGCRYLTVDRSLVERLTPERPMPPINLGILAHVDAGKTSLTERLLFESGAIDTLGRVDDGTTRTDSMDLERRRGITIRAAVTSLRLGDLSINLIDTPGHSDFIAEVERAFGVLDAAVLVLSAVEGVQPQTVILWRALRRVGVPTLFFINKVDRRGADVDRVVDQIRRRLSPALVIHTRVRDTGTAKAQVTPVPLTHGTLLEPIVESDDGLLRRWVEDRPIASQTLLSTLQEGVLESRLFPIVFGSAVTGAGVNELQWVLSELLPTPNGQTGDPAGVVFAIDHDDRGRKAWIRLWQGELRVRDKVSLSGRDEERITQIAVPTPQGLDERPLAEAGDIAALRGMSRARIGDTIGTPPPRRTPHMAPPTLQAIVEPVDPTQRGAMFAGLSELAEEDPLIGLELDEADGSATVRIHGEVQKEVIGSLLEERFNVKVRFHATSVMCIETVLGTGAAVEKVHTDNNPYLATIGLQIDGDETVDGIEFSPGIERGNLPPSFITACEEGTRAALTQGLYGWPVTGCRVTMTASAYMPRQSHSHQKFSKAMSSVGADFRNLAPVVAMVCLQTARTQVCEPIERFDLEVPGKHLRTALAALSRLAAIINTTTESGQYTRVGGFIPSGHVTEFAQALPNITGGEGVLTTQMDHYVPVKDDLPPRRARTGLDPRERETWFRSVPR
jgi:ribosomal protection tetracycline resistance protein